MKEKVVRILGPLFGLTLFAAALWVLHHELREYRYEDIVGRLHDVPGGFFDPEYLKRFPAGIVRKGGKIVAFANLWPGAEKEELSIDLMRYLPDAPAEVMEFLLIELMRWGKEEGYRWFNLGMAPLSGLEDRMLAPFWNRVGAFVYRHSERFYHFQGPREYKEKFHPEWRPKYLASPGGWRSPGS